MTAIVARYSSRPRSSACRIAVSGLARKFWTITSWIAGVLPGDRADREDRLRPLGEVLADADQQSGGERDRQPAGVLEHPQPDRRVLVGRAVVGLALLREQPGRGGLQHHPHRRRDRLEPVQLLPRHDAGVEVRQQAGLLEHPDRHRPHVGQRRVVALLVEPLPRLGPAVLGPVAQGEQRLQAPQLPTLRGRCRGSRRGRGTARARRARRAPASRRTCSSGTGPGTAG